jgi:hypothetical protein
MPVPAIKRKKTKVQKFQEKAVRKVKTRRVSGR